MKHLLTVVCVLGFLCGGALSMYSSISIGSQGLTALASSLRSIGTVMTTYYKNLNAARRRIMSGITKLQLQVNTTYTTLNETYGNSQPSMENMMYSLEWFTKQFFYGEQQVNSQIGYDLNYLNSELQQTMDQIMQSYNNLANSYAYQDNAEQCTQQFTTSFLSLPSQLTKFGTCLKKEADTVPTVVAPVLKIFNLIKSDLTAMNNQLKICAATSTSCINEYFNNIYMELSNVNYELSMAGNLLNFYQYDAASRNQLCGELIKQNVMDTSQNLMSQFGMCLHPVV